MIERYEKEMRRMFEISPEKERNTFAKEASSVETAVFPEDAPEVPQFQQREQSGVEIPEPQESAPPMTEQPQEPRQPMAQQPPEFRLPITQQPEEPRPPVTQRPQEPLQPMMPLPPVQPQQEQPMPDKTGSIVVEVTTGRGAVPLSGVTVIIDRLDVSDPQGRQELIAVETTNADGRTKPVEVRTVSRDLSLTPGNGNPFATFYISAKADGFEPVRSRPVDVFAEEMSILKIDLIPKPENLGERGAS